MATKDRKKPSDAKQSGAKKAENKAEELTGRVKEAAGAVTNDESLRSEGRTEQFGAQAKDAVEKVAGGARDLVDKGVDRVRETLKRNRES